MALTNAERQKKYRESKLSASGNHYRLQLVVGHKADAELASIIVRNKRLNQEIGTSQHPVTKQDIISAAIHNYAVVLGLEFDAL